MWRISEVKQRGKTMFRLNYWKTVLVAFIAAVIIGGGAATGGATSASTSSVSSGLINSFRTDTESYQIEDSDSSFDAGDLAPYYFEDPYDIDSDFNINGYTGDIDSYTNYDYSPSDLLGSILLFTGIIAVIACIVLVIAIALDVVIFNPLEVGTRRFFYRNLYEKAEVKEIMYSFDHNYKNVVQVMFFKNLYNALWYLALFIPGIIKSYEYSMIPYLLAEYPDMPKEDAFAISRYMMDGNKWHAFLLDLSFIGWNILSIIPFVGTFFVNPYYNMTHAALYDTLKEKKRPFAGAEDAASYTDPYGYSDNAGNMNNNDVNEY